MNDTRSEDNAGGRSVAIVGFTPLTEGARGLPLSQQLTVNSVARASSWMSPLTSGDEIFPGNQQTQHIIEQHAAFLQKWKFF